MIKNKKLKETVIFFITFLCIFYIFYFNLNLLKNNYFKIEEKKIENETSFIRDQKMSGITDKLKYAEEKDKIFNNVFLSAEKQVEFITKLEEIAENNNVTQKISLTKGVKFKDNIYIMDLTSNISGTMDNALKYIDELNKIIYFVNIENISIVSTNQNSESGELKNYNINYKAKTYWK